MNQGVQKRYKAIGDAGCFALCILQAGNPACTDWEVFIEIGKAVQKKFVNEAMLVLRQAALMGMAAGGEWTHTVELPSYEVKPGEICIEQWAYTDAKKIYHEHFGHRTPAGLWDPYGDSETFKQGKCISKRIFRRVK